MAAAFVALQVSQEFHNGSYMCLKMCEKCSGFYRHWRGHTHHRVWILHPLHIQNRRAVSGGRAAQSQKLLLNILPESIVRKLRESPDTIAERFDHCTVLFSDIVGFTGIAKKMSAVEVVSLLNEIFSAFDDLAEQHGLEKIKTIGDAYMVVGGLPEPDAAHAEKVARFAIDMLGVVKRYRDENDVPLELRVGINTGAAVAGVIGKKKFIYDLWGDSVNTASRMESHGIPGQIQVTESTLCPDQGQVQSGTARRDRSQGTWICEKLSAARRWLRPGLLAGTRAKNAPAATQSQPPINARPPTGARAPNERTCVKTIR
jgi:class 3 adenylate cyclase